MNTPSCAIRGLVVWLSTAVAALGAYAVLHPEMQAGWAAARAGSSFVDLITGLCATALLACAAWAWLVTSAVLVEALRGGRRVAGVPPWARRLVVAACGLAVLAAAPAQASRGDLPHDHGRAGVAVLDGLPLPDRAVDRPARRPLVADHAIGPAVGQAVGQAVAKVVVRPGDSLWSIAADRRGPGATDHTVAAVAADVDALYRANRAVIGVDPDLITPGQHLRVPLPGEHPDR